MSLRKSFSIWLTLTWMQIATMKNILLANQEDITLHANLINALNHHLLRLYNPTAIITLRNGSELDLITQIDTSLINPYYLVHTIKDSKNNIRFPERYSRTKNPLFLCTLYIIIGSDTLETFDFLQHSLEKGILSPSAFFIVSLLPFNTSLLKPWLVPQIARLLYFQPSSKWSAKLIEVHTLKPSVKGSHLRHVDLWNGQHFLILKEKAAFHWNATKNPSLYGQPLRICTFHFPPSIIETKPGHYTGIDIAVIDTLAEYMNFTPSYYQPPRGKWGSLMTNGSWDGLMGQVLTGEADMGVANLFMTRDRISNFDMSFPYDVDCATFLTPSPLPLPQWQALILPFELSLWLAVLACVLLGGLSLYFSAELYYYCMDKPPGQFHGDLGAACLYNLQSLWGIGGPNDRSSWPIRWYGSFLWLFYMLITSDYRAALTACLSVPTTQPPIDSLRHLLQSGIEWGGYSAEMANVFAMSLEPNVHQIGVKYTILPLDNAINLTARGLFATMENRQHVDFVINTEHLNSYGRPTLHGMRECLNSYPIAIALPKRSIYKTRVNEIIQRLGQTGLVPYWLQLAIRTGRATAINHMADFQKPPENAVFSLYHLQGAFYCLILGFIPAILAFLVEFFFAGKSN